MAETFYSVPGLNVETYDLFAAANPAAATDVPFFLETARETGGPVLELGCGTGRVAWPLAEAGFEVVGLDRSEAMLEAAEAKRARFADETAKRARFVAGDMVRFALPERFRLALIPFRAFQSVLDVEDQIASLGCIHRHLVPGGRLVIDLFDPRLDLCLPGERDVDPLEPVTVPETGRTVTIEVIRHENDPLRQVLTERWRFTEREPDGRVRRREEEVLTLRWTYRFEMRHLLERSGFAVEAEYADFQRSPPAYGLEQVWVARRP